MKKKDTVFDIIKRVHEEFEERRRRARPEYIFPKTCPNCSQPLDKWVGKIQKCRSCGKLIIPYMRIWN